EAPGRRRGSLRLRGGKGDRPPARSGGRDGGASPTDRPGHGEVSPGGEGRGRAPLPGRRSVPERGREKGRGGHPQRGRRGGLPEGRGGRGEGLRCGEAGEP